MSSTIFLKVKVLALRMHMILLIKLQRASLLVLYRPRAADRVAVVRAEARLPHRRAEDRITIMAVPIGNEE